MSRKQYLALSEQTARNALDESPTYLFYPITGKLEPQPEYKEDPVPEWRGTDTAQGASTDERTSTSWKFPWESRIYPGAELVALFKYLTGSSPTPTALTAPDSAANRYIYQTVTEMFGEGTPLVDKALAIVPNTCKGSSTYSQSFIGGRIKDAEIDFKGGEAATLKMNFIGGPWIGAPEQTATAGYSLPAAKAFRSVPKLYIGSGATLTGVAPNYTDFAPGTMALAKPDDLTIKIETGLDDVYKMNGEEGPSVTERKSQWKITIDYTIDFSDPASGWSSGDAWVARFSAAQYLPVMITLNSSEIIPSCSAQTYAFGLYLPKMKLTNDPVDRKNDGSKEKIKFTLESRVDSTINVAAFLKLIC